MLRQVKYVVIKNTTKCFGVKKMLKFKNIYEYFPDFSWKKLGNSVKYSPYSSNYWISYGMDDLFVPFGHFVELKFRI